MIMTIKDLSDLTARDVMSREVVSIPEKMSLRRAARLLLDAQVSGAPVVDEGGRCTGVLSTTDFMRWVEKEHGCPGKSCVGSDFLPEWQLDGLDAVPTDAVRTLMTPDPVMASPEARIGELARMMLDAHVHRVIIVDEARRPVGIVSSIDLLAAVARAEAPT
ncbi:MAG: CBS domain-containing protein [Planctomycetes bacterium]|nr:CBS domain-containing protein [Planctomycetota bacterium]